MKDRLSISKLIILLIVTSMIVMIFSLSRYKATVATQDVTKVAIMGNNVNFNIENSISGYPGCTDMLYPIQITNEDENQICEVTQKFNMKLTGLEEANIPLEINLYRDSACTNKMNANENGIYESNDFKFSAGVKNTITVYLKIRWPANKNSDYYALEIDYFKINVELTQID